MVYLKSQEITCPILLVKCWVFYYLLVGQGHNGAPIASTINILISPPQRPSRSILDTPIVFYPPKLVCSNNNYMVGVPCFFAKILRVQACTSCRRKPDPSDPWPYDLIWLAQDNVAATPPPRPPPPALFGNIVGSAPVASATSNLSSGPSGAHRFFVDALSLHIVDDTMRNNSHINRYIQYFF